VGFILSIKNVGAGEAKEVHARLIQTDDYGIITEKSEMKALLTNKGRPFGPELAMNPKSAKKTAVLYEIYYKDPMGRVAKLEFEDDINFIEEEIPFQRIENPYIIGDIVRDERMFFGREKLLEEIIDTFKGEYQMNPIFLYGQRRTGKTSILFHLEKRLEDDFIPVFFTTSEIFGRKSFYEDLMEKIKEKTGFSDIKIPNISKSPFNIFKKEFYAKFKQKLKGKEIVLIIDEYQRIDELITEGYYDESVIDFLNALVQDGEIKVILAGFLPPEELQNDKWVEFMRFFNTKNVSSLSREDTVGLIYEPVKRILRYDEGAIEKIISLSGRHPYFVQLICHTMVECHNHDKTNLIGYNHITEHLSDYSEKGHNVFLDILFNQTQEMERRILFSIHKLMGEKNATSAHKSEIEHYFAEHSKKTNDQDIEKALSHLERKEIIRRSTEHPDHYEFTIDLYRYWIKWNLLE
jgi:Cdc6-like AAA superfamily ATPase